MTPIDTTLCRFVKFRALANNPQTVLVLKAEIATVIFLVVVGKIEPQL